MDQPKNTESGLTEGRPHGTEQPPAQGITSTPGTSNGPPAPSGPDQGGADKSLGAPADASPPPAPPLTPTGWLVQNGPYLFVFAVAAILLYRFYGLDGIFRGVMVVLGLSFVVFIHELGHFLAAKWCDVHVLTFSIGFGPPLPGCSFQRGETTYKLAVLPLGGYVNMVGEGPEADEDENYPRSFKNKSVGQRMLIISAGVIMNVLFGALCYMLVYRYTGVPRTPAAIWSTEAGSPAWKNGVRAGWQIVGVGKKEQPWFEDVRIEVALSEAGYQIPFTFKDHEGDPMGTIPIEPRSDENDLLPVIGFLPPPQLRLEPPAASKKRALPVLYDSAAAFARSFDLRPGDVPVSSSARENGKVVQTPLTGGARGWLELSKRLRDFRGEEFAVRVKRQGEEVTVQAGPGFEFGDRLVGTSDPTADDPFQVQLLPDDPTRTDKKVPDPFAFRQRLRALAGRPAVVQVVRDKEDKDSAGAPSPETATPVNVLVPPAYHMRLGARMKMGKVVAVREGSPALEVGVKPDDEIHKVEVQFGDEKKEELSHREMDPVRLPSALAERIASRPEVGKWKVFLTVLRIKDHNEREQETLEPMRWDPTFKLEEEIPTSRAAPLSIPQLGLAYRVESTVAEVEPGSPAEKAGLLPHDEVQEIRFREGGRTLNDPTWSPWLQMKSKRDKNTEVYDQWAHYFWLLQRNDYAVVEVRVKRAGQDAKVTLGPIEAVPDESWPAGDPESLGLRLMNDSRLQKANNLLEALVFGVDQTVGFIKQIPLQLRSMVRRRISSDMVGGPILIAQQAFSVAGQDLSVFALFLAFISVNLAVVNFLPIPVLDGGHMVFLVYEWIRRKPAPESVRVIATYVGLATILLLMVFVFYNDIVRNLKWFFSFG